MYKSNGEDSVIRLSDGAYIPFADGNSDYEEYKQWVKNGGAPDPQHTESERVDMAISSKKSEIRSKFDEAIALVTAGANPNEVQSWSIQEKEARNPTLPTPMIDALALSRGIDRVELIGRIIAKADAYAAYVGTQLGKLQKLEDQLAAATTISDMEAIQW